MDFLKPIVLGIVQGITEWLPISSNAHLKIVPALLGWPDPGAANVAVMQLGTMAAVLIYYARDIGATLTGMVRAFQPGGDKNSPEARLGLAVAVGTVPICVLGLLLKDFIKGPFRSNYIIAGTLITVGFLLLLAEHFAPKKRPLTKVNLLDGLIVGLAQCLALIPGSSRSGSTFIGAFLTGLEREAAIRFSFLLSIPAITLAGLYELYSDVLKGEPPPPGAPPTLHWQPAELLLATVVSGLVGYVSIAFLINYLKRHSNLVFVIYRVLLGLLLIYLTSTGQIAK